MDAQWQKQKINLNSVIDSNMTDMLRSLQDPTFIFNRQVLQGGYLPTSLRYEDNGWFCGKYGYDFELNSPVALKDTQLYMGDMKVEKRHSYVSETYQITSDDESGDVNFIYYPLTRVLAYASETEPGTEWVHDDDGNITIVKVSGKTHDFKRDYTFYIKIDNEELSIAKPDDWVIVDPEETIDFDGDGNPDVETVITFDKRRFVYEYTVYDKDEFFTDSFTLHYITPFYIGEEVHEPVVRGNKITYGDNNILTVEVDAANLTATATSEDIEISCVSVCTDTSCCACAVEVQGIIPIDITDNVTAVTEKYYTDLDLAHCLCTSNTSIGKNPTATVMKDGESCQVPIIAAGYTCLATSCEFEACNNLCTGCYTYAENISGAVPIWSAQTIFVLRFFGDDIFWNGQNAGESGTVMTIIPEQCIYNECCTIIPEEKTFYCTVYGNKIYDFDAAISKDHVFSSGGKWYVAGVNQCMTASGYSNCISTCIPLVYTPTNQCVNINACILLDSVCSNMKVQTIGCITKMTADAAGFSTGSFDRNCPFAPIPGTVPQFIIHDAYNLDMCINNTCQNSRNLINCLLSKVYATAQDNGMTVTESLSRAANCIYNYWCSNYFFSNVQITPVSVIFPVAGWFNSNVCFKGVNSVECTDRSYLDNLTKDMFCVDTNYCSVEQCGQYRPVLLCTFTASTDGTVCICDNFTHGGFITIQTSNGCPGETGHDTCWQVTNPATCTICFTVGAGGNGGDSGVGFGVDYCYDCYSNGSVSVCCGATICAPSGAGGAGGFGGLLLARKACYGDVASEPLSPAVTYTQDISCNDTQYERNVLAIECGSGVALGNPGRNGGYGTYSCFEIPASGYTDNSKSCIYICVEACVNEGGPALSTSYSGTSCYHAAGSYKETAEIYPACILDGCNFFLTGGKGANASKGISYEEEPQRCCIAYTQGQGCACQYAQCDGELLKICTNHGYFVPFGFCSETDKVIYHDCPMFFGCISGYDDCICTEIPSGALRCDFNCYVTGCATQGIITGIAIDPVHNRYGGCPGNAGFVKASQVGCFTCCDTEIAKVSVYAYQYVEDVNYDTTNLQNENNCFGIHLKCNDIAINNLLYCCCDGSIDKYNLELVPTLSDGFIYITSAIDSMPAWATSRALTEKNFWCTGGSSLIPVYQGTYDAINVACEIPGTFCNGVTLEIQSSSGCNGISGDFFMAIGGDSGYGICLSLCDATTYHCCTYIVPGGAGGGGGVNRAGFGSRGQTLCVDLSGHCICDIKYCIICNTHNSATGACSPFCYDPNSSNNGTAGDRGRGGYGYDVPGACFINTTKYFIKVYEMKKMEGVEPWSVSTDTATATKLGTSRDLSTSLHLPVNFYSVNRLVDTAVSTTHDSYYNLSVLEGACAVNTQIVFTDACGCEHCGYTEWTRDTAVQCGEYIKPCARIYHNTCDKDYTAIYNLTANCFEESLQTSEGCPKVTYTVVPSCEKGNSTGNCACHIPGYTTDSCAVTYSADIENFAELSEPYMLVHWHTDYPFCTLLPIPYITNCTEGGEVTRSAEVRSFNKGIYDIGYNNNADTITFDSCQESITSKVYSADIAEIVCPSPDVLPRTMCACICGSDFDYATFTLEGVYKNCGNKQLAVKCIECGCIKLDYDTCGETSIKTDDIITNETFLDVTAKDIEKPEEEKKTIASVELNSEFQLVKQQWDTTVETENMWWLDEDHIMLLTKDKLIVKEKQFEESGDVKYDDWNGNQWEVTAAYKRTDYINSTVTKFGVSNTYDQTAADNGGAFLYTFTTMSSSKFRLDVYSPLDDMSKLFTKTFTIKEQNYGEVLSQDNDKLGMYVFVNAKTLISQATVSATHVAHHYIIGIHFDNCLRQWAFFFNDENYTCQKITGYGYVAPNGTLTGGQFPSVCVDAVLGFHGAVNFIDDLQNVKNNSINGAFTYTGIYGTQEQQWYIYKEIPKVCSHIQFAEAAEVKNGYSGSAPLVCKWLPLKSTYSALYSSPSFLLNRLTGFMPEPTTLGSIFDFGNSSINTLVNVLTSIASPSVWFLNICWTKFGFLNQAIGQYAYTYRNTDKDISLEAAKFKADVNAAETAEAKEFKAFAQNADTLTRDALSFDKQEFAQTCTTKSNSNGGVTSFWLCLLQAGISGLNNAAVANSPVVNEALNEENTAKTLSQFAMDNALNTISTDLGIQRATDVILASKVTAVKTLDMFYSTSSNSRMYAGPGYVCHNFIGYCVAQSMSNQFLSGSQSTMFTALTVLSNLSFMFKTMILKTINDLFEKLADAMDGQGSFVMGSGITWGDIGAAVMHGAAFVAEQLVKTNEFFIEVMPELLRAVCPGYPNAQFSSPGIRSRHNIDIEAKHNYGSKHVTFMYPCFGCESTYFTKESVEAVLKDTAVEDDFTPQNSIMKTGKGAISLYTSGIDNVTDNSNDDFKSALKGKIHTHYIYAKGSSSVDNVPPDTAVVEGTTTFLPSVPFKNENIDVTMVFPTAPVQDYMVDDMWNIGLTANEGGILWVSVKDTKLIDGDYSNIVITDDTALIASPYTAIELKKQIEKEYIRPVAITPNALAWNMTGLNVSYNGKMYHGFDGTGYRVVHWAGTSGMGTEDLTLHYCFQENNHFKRSNILMPNHFFGNFTSLPVIDADTDNKDSLYHQIEIDTKGIGIENLTSAENKNLARYAIPVFTEQLSTMPSVIKTLSSYKLNVIQGVTSLTSDIRITQNKYKIPKSIDFNINKNLYRATDEYINALNESGLSVGDLTSKLGLEFIGATPTQAFFYSDATRSYYSFTGNAMIQKQDVWNRFKDIKDGKWDFVNQNVVFQCIGNMTRVMDDVSDRDDDLVDNIFIATMDGQQHGITGEVTPPGTPVFNNKSWFKTYSFAGGLTFQGPNRYVVNRFICLDYMINDIVANKGKWKKLKRDKFNPFRKYREDFVAVNNRVTEGVSGWTHNPFVLATAPLGVSEETDCLFEWELTFTWTDEMDMIYKDNEYACVNIMAQTMCPGGKKRCEPTHLYLHKDLFTRSENTGYYSFKFASRNGAGNREQLFVWSDAYIAMTGLSVNYKVITERRTMPLAVSQVDIKEMKEF